MDSTRSIRLRVVTPCCLAAPAGAKANKVFSVAVEL